MRVVYTAASGTTFDLPIYVVEEAFLTPAMQQLGHHELERERLREGEKEKWREGGVVNTASVACSSALCCKWKLTLSEFHIV